uniref:Vicilin-like seed storage protein At2g18540 n=1 Tax=Anisakis simplex TaxID=6269 RepID=A0A0M3KE65_ANISI
LKSEEAEVKPIEETAGKDEDEVDRKREKSAEPSPEIVREQERVPEKEIREESSPPKDEAKVEKEGEERSLVEGVESIDLNKEGNINEGDSVVMNNTDENVNKVIVNGNEPNANDGDQHKTATHHAVEVVLEETEKEEKATSEEEDETKIERKRREFENKQAEMLKDITNVSVEMMLYSRSYLMLMRDVVKELKLKTCPVEETELKSLGIDIGTAPVVNMDRQQRRLEGVSRAFAPGWMPDNKNPLRPKQYHGRLSDRGHSQRTDRDRKRGPISRPSIDRPAREPVKLHKSENAWKHEALSQLDKDQKQVIEESQESGKSEFRSGILTRCQQTFETKRQDEINKKREEAAAEKDEKRQKELKIEVMEMEAKE